MLQEIFLWVENLKKDYLSFYTIPVKRIQTLYVLLAREYVLYPHCYWWVSNVNYLRLCSWCISPWLSQHEATFISFTNLISNPLAGEQIVINNNNNKNELHHPIENWYFTFSVQLFYINANVMKTDIDLQIYFVMLQFI